MQCCRIENGRRLYQIFQNDNAIALGPAFGMFQCVYNLPFAAKLAKGMSLRYEAPPIVADINHRTPTKHTAFGGLFI